jgi:hypothetical protein
MNITGPDQAFPRGKYMGTLRAPVHGDQGFRLKATSVSGG